MAELRDGYAYRSSARYPREPELVVVSVEGGQLVEEDRAVPSSYVGLAHFDYTQHRAFRCRPPGKRVFYLFQT